MVGSGRLGSVGASSRGVAVHPGLLERERELAAIADVMNRVASDSSSMVLVEGPAGIGKTRLLRESIAGAQDAGFSVLQARGGELERGMPFGVARQLLEPVVTRSNDRERTRLLAGSAEFAVPALGLGEPRSEGHGGDPLAPIHGLFWLVANLAELRPVLIAIDDLQWADRETIRFLDYLSRRLADVPVAVLAGVRSGEPDTPTELERLRLEAELVRPSPLSRSGIESLIEARLGAAPSTELSDACTAATKGNPFLLEEVLRAVRADSIVPGKNAAIAIEELGSERLAHNVLIRLGQFGDDAIDLARAIAVLGASAQLRHAAALARIDEDHAPALCDRLREAEILAPGMPVEFVHPLVRSAIYREIGEGSRSVLHRRAAETLDEAGADIGAIAPHLVTSAPNGDDWVVAKLREAARSAMSSGAPEAAARFLERALEEPPVEEVAIRYELGRALWGSDQFRAPEVLASVAAELTEGAQQRQAMADAAWTYFDVGNLAEAIRWLETLRDATPDRDSDEALSAEAAIYCLTTVSRGRQPGASERISAVASRLPDGAHTPGQMLVRLALAWERFGACRPISEIEELTTEFPPPWTGEGAVPNFATKVLTWSGRFDRARELTMRGLESARVTGLVHVESWRESFLAEIERLAGRLIESEAHARTAWNVIEDLAPVSLAGWSARANLLATLIARGSLEEAAKLAEDAPLSAKLSEVPITPIPLEIRGTLRIAQGRLEEGAEDLLVLGEDVESFNFLNPAPVPWRQEAAPALARLDRTAEAAKLIEVAEERARRFGVAHVIGSVLRARALTEPRRRSIETLRDSVAALEEYGPPHELARSLLELGAALRRNGRRSDSREPLRRALELAHRAGAGAVEARAREELAAIGSRPRSAFRTGVASLTASELRCARLAAEGLSNVEIAQRLYVTRKTVEKHLGNAYSKLEIGGREELPRALESD